MRRLPAYLAQVEEDLSETLAMLQKRSMAPAVIPVPIRKKFLAMHHAIYSLCIWSHFIKGEEHGRFYLIQIASDAIQIEPHVLCGFSRTAMLLARSIIENTLRHIYFTDHPVEFERSNRDAKFYLSAEELFEYCRNYVHFIDPEKRFQPLSKLRHLYSALSATVHGGKVSNMALHKALKTVVFDPADLDDQLKHVSAVTESCNFLMMIFHKKRSSKLPVGLRKIIMMTIAARGRKVIHGLV